MKNRFLVAAFLLLSAGVFAQVSYETNDPNQFPTPLGFLGWDDTDNTTLRVRQNDRVRVWLRDTTYNHVNDGPLENVTRMAIHENTSSTGVSFPYDSFQPASMLHIGRAIPQPLVRSWMHIGTTYGNRHDGMYVGIYDVPDDVYNPNSSRKADAVIAWGCNSIGSIYGPDNMRFIFLAPTNGVDGTGPEMDDEGMEVARFSPAGNFGIGNFFTNGLDQHPSQRLDVDGTARLRQMPSEEFNVVITGVYATDPEVDGDYILNYSTIEDFTSTLDIECDWDVVNSGNDVAMGYPGACVEGSMLVGTDVVPVGSPKAYITKDEPGVTFRSDATVGAAGSQIAAQFNGENSGLNNFGVQARAFNAGRNNFGVDALARNAVVDNFGVRGIAQTGRNSYGVRGEAYEAQINNFGVYGLASGPTEGGGNPMNNVGVYGEARGNANDHNFAGYFLSCGTKNIAVYAESCDHGGVAVYAVGNIIQTNQPITLSDESVKNNITGVENATALINQLQPKQYQYNTDQFAHLNLPTETSYGFVAQEVQAVLPNMVKQITHPAKYDTTGAMISPEEELLGIQYQEFIAILTAGVKEQQAQIQSQDDQIAGLMETMMQMQEQMQMMQEQIDGCCHGDITPKNSGMGQDNSPKANPFGQNELYQNIPNPFRGQTTIRYTLEQGGRAMLNIHDSNGREIAQLENAEQVAGTYSYVWNATGLPAGTYHYSLIVDGELLVKRAIKLQD